MQTEPIICPSTNPKRECAVVVNISNAHPGWLAVEPRQVRWTDSDRHTLKMVEITTPKGYIHGGTDRQVHLKTQVVGTTSQLYKDFDPGDLYVNITENPDKTTTTTTPTATTTAPAKPTGSTRALQTATPGGATADTAAPASTSLAAGTPGEAPAPTPAPDAASTASTATGPAVVPPGTAATSVATTAQRTTGAPAPPPTNTTAGAGAGTTPAAGAAVGDTATTTANPADVAEEIAVRVREIATLKGGLKNSTAKDRAAAVARLEVLEQEVAALNQTRPAPATPGAPPSPAAGGTANTTGAQGATPPPPGTTPAGTAAGASDSSSSGGGTVVIIIIILVAVVVVLALVGCLVCWLRRDTEKDDDEFRQEDIRMSNFSVGPDNLQGSRRPSNAPTGDMSESYQDTAALARQRQTSQHDYALGNAGGGNDVGNDNAYLAPRAGNGNGNGNGSGSGSPEYLAPRASVTNADYLAPRASMDTGGGRPQSAEYLQPRASTDAAARPQSAEYLQPRASSRGYVWAVQSGAHATARARDVCACARECVCVCVCVPT